MLWIIKENILICIIGFNIQSNTGTEWPSFPSAPSSSPSSYSPPHPFSSHFSSSLKPWASATEFRAQIQHSKFSMTLSKDGPRPGLLISYVLIPASASILCLRPQKHLPSGKEENFPSTRAQDTEVRKRWPLEVLRMFLSSAAVTMGLYTGQGHSNPGQGSPRASDWASSLNYLRATRIQLSSSFSYETVPPGFPEK